MNTTPGARLSTSKGLLMTSIQQMYNIYGSLQQWWRKCTAAMTTYRWYGRISIKRHKILVTLSYIHLKDYKGSNRWKKGPYDKKWVDSIQMRHQIRVYSLQFQKDLFPSREPKDILLVLYKSGHLNMASSIDLQHCFHEIVSSQIDHDTNY